MRVLIVEDEFIVAQLLAILLDRAGLRSFCTNLGVEAIELATIYDYELIVLDLNLPDMHGSDVLRVLRNKSIATPVLVMTGDTSNHHKLRCLKLGADDFLTKPFHGDEFIARIRAIVRRSQVHMSSVVEVGYLTINLTKKTVLIKDRALNLTPREFQVLEVLAMHKGAVVTKKEILNHLYDGMDEPTARVIDVHVCKIRRKLEVALGAGSHIQTMRGCGYSLSEAAPLTA